MDESWLRERVREVMRAGHLPDRPADRTWGGPGSGLPCTVCGQALHPEVTELELEFWGLRESGVPSVYHLHVGCFNAWQLECGPPSGSAKGLSAKEDVGTMRTDERNSAFSRGET